ncbi:MAG: gamma-glutamyltransferase [Candidatus Marinimicrobia bacterium]|nr:gamma-glutamyltransferase [Candidatus Neomarinimicrobiota bacterium]
MKKLIVCIIYLFFTTLSFGQSLEAGKNGVVVSASKIASDIGIQIMREGGNSVDAAIAVSFALAVVWPEAGNLGGGGFMVIRFPDGSATTIDYREKASENAHEKMYLDRDGKPISGLSTEGPLSAAVPGTVAGMALAWEKYGLLPWNKLIEPAIELADKGFPVTYHLHTGLKNHYEEMAQFTATKDMFFPKGSVPEVGDILKFPDLAQTLGRIAQEGADDFYRGLTALKIVRSVNAAGGILTYDDLKNYRAIEQRPLRFQYRDHEIITMAPPSSGGVVLGQILKILENFPMSHYDYFSPDAIHKIVEAERFAYANRSKYLGDPYFVNNHTQYLLSDKLNDSLASEIKFNVAGNSLVTAPVFVPESEQTTHFSIIDKNGLAVSNTTTLNSSYGSCFVVEGTGILLNNEMDDFSIKPGQPNQFGLLGSEANSIQPNKKMLSSMTPAIVTQDNQIKYILGSPGGSTIITTVAQVIINLVDFGMNLRNAVHAPRFHHQWLPDNIYFEKFGIDKTLFEALEKMGYKLVIRSAIGDLNAIGIDHNLGIYIGVADNRRQSAVSCY